MFPVPSLWWCLGALLLSQKNPRSRLFPINPKPTSSEVGFLPVDPAMKATILYTAPTSTYPSEPGQVVTHSHTIPHLYFTIWLRPNNMACLGRIHTYWV